MQRLVFLLALAACGPAPTERPAAHAPTETGSVETDAPVAIAPSSAEPEATSDPSVAENALPSRAPRTSFELAGIAIPEPTLSTTSPGWTAARTALETELPYPPGRTMAAINRWAQGPFKRWVERRMDLTQQATAALARAAVARARAAVARARP